MMEVDVLTPASIRTYVPSSIRALHRSWFAGSLPRMTSSLSSRCVALQSPLTEAHIELKSQTTKYHVAISVLRARDGAGTEPFGLMTPCIGVDRLLNFFGSGSQQVFYACVTYSAADSLTI